MIGSQQKLALLLGTTRKVVNHWLNSGILLPVQYALQIEILTQGEISAETLSPHAKQQILQFKQYLLKTKQ